MKKAILAWLKWFSRFLLVLLSQVSGRRRLLGLVAEAVEGESDFVTYHCRPKLAVVVGTRNDVVRKDANRAGQQLAIVMQGPIAHKDNFTLETLKIYQQHFSDSKIILSTWEDEDLVALREFEDLGITLILNQKPTYAGVSNINLQIASARSGVRKAQVLGVKYALKTRTDQRMYAPNLADFLYNLTELFPVQGKWPRQKKRIVGCSHNTFKYRMYGLSDMLIYGNIDDMLLYWDIELDERVLNEQQRQATNSLRSYARWRVCEIYLATEFLTKVGRELKWSLRDSWSAFAEHFCVVDKEQLDLFWPKYGRSEYRWLRYGEDARTQELAFRDWLDLYAGLEGREIPEHLLDDI